MHSRSLRHIQRHLLTPCAASTLLLTAPPTEAFEFVGAPYSFSVTNNTVSISTANPPSGTAYLGWTYNEFVHQRINDLQLSLADSGIETTIDDMPLSVTAFNGVRAGSPIGIIFTTVTYDNAELETSGFTLTNNPDGSGFFSFDVADPDFAISLPGATTAFDEAEYEVRLTDGNVLTSLQGITTDGSYQINFAANEFDGQLAPGINTLELWSKDLATDYQFTGLTTTIVPEPESLALLTLAALLVARRRRD